ncbi:O-methyltransferase [Burkholderia gladioli]|uniref:O-methyltransferase n=1 Tax=Burkholderia gladioli TaxID=28095 RepID=UPI003FA60AF1
MTTSSHVLLQRLHEQNRAELIGRARARFPGDSATFLDLVSQYEALAPRLKGQFLSDHGLSGEDDSERSRGTSLSLAISAELGSLLRNLVLSHRPMRILELGSSYGVSTLYFADALRTLGRGTVIATERDAMKCARLRDHLAAAKVERYVELREGDAFETLEQLDGPFDIVFIDVWADLYLRLFQRVEPLLRPGSIVLADNMYTAGEAVQPFKRYLDAHPRISSTTLDFESGLEFAVVTG